MQVDTDTQHSSRDTEPEIYSRVCPGGHARSTSLRRHVGEGRGVDHTGIVDVTIQARTRLQTQSKDTRVRRCMHAQDPDRDPCTCHKVCRSATVTPPRRQTMRQGGSLQLCCGAAHTESTCYTACIHIRFWPLHGPLTGLGSSAAVYRHQTVLAPVVTLLSMVGSQSASGARSG